MPFAAALGAGELAAAFAQLAIIFAAIVGAAKLAAAFAPFLAHFAIVVIAMAIALGARADGRQRHCQQAKGQDQVTHDFLLRKGTPNTRGPRAKPA